MHFHQQLFKGGENVFYNPDGYGHLSQTALYYIGGLLTHGPGPAGADQSQHEFLPAVGAGL
jgi:glutamine synthetase